MPIDNWFYPNSLGSMLFSLNLVKLIHFKDESYLYYKVYTGTIRNVKISLI